MEHKTNFNFMTLNVQGLHNVRNRQTLFSWLNCAKPDIICLQETHSASEAEFQTWVTSETNNQNNMQHYLVHSSPGSARCAGVAILYKPCFQVKTTETDTHGRFLLATFCHQEVASAFQVLAVYSPNQKHPREEFFASLLPLMDPTLLIVLCRDSNAVVDKCIVLLRRLPSRVCIAACVKFVHSYNASVICYGTTSCHTLLFVPCRDLCCLLFTFTFAFFTSLSITFLGDSTDCLTSFLRQ